MYADDPRLSVGPCKLSLTGALATPNSNHYQVRPPLLPGQGVTCISQQGSSLLYRVGLHFWNYPVDMHLPCVADSPFIVRVYIRSDIRSADSPHSDKAKARNHRRTTDPAYQPTEKFELRSNPCNKSCQILSVWTGRPIPVGGGSWFAPFLKLQKFGPRCTWNK